MPAFRADPRCEVTALCGSEITRTRKLADEAGVPKAFGDWGALLADSDIDAVAIATLPSLQAEIAVAALQAGKPVFAEKPMAGDLSGARAMLQAAEQSGLPTAIDFNFHQIKAWLRASELLDAGAVGTLRHVTVHWHVESYSIQKRMHNWKTLGGDDGGGVLGNFISHCFHYLEWFVGPIAGLQARVAGLPDDPELETTVAMALQFAAGPQVSLSMSCASYKGAGHRLEFFGDDGTLVLDNPGLDYMRGFELTVARRPDDFVRLQVDDPIDAKYPDGRIAPVSRLANQFFDAIAGKPYYKPNVAPGFAAGYRAQVLIDAAQRSHRQGVWIDVTEKT
jgi:predicted dehydrogenase